MGLTNIYEFLREVRGMEEPAWLAERIAAVPDPNAVITELAPRILEKLKDGTFVKAFTDKGRLSQLLINMPVRVILESKAALLGAAGYAEARAAEISGISARSASIHS